MKLFDRLGKLRDRRRPYCTMIVPAAGESRRMGGGNKLLLPLEGLEKTQVRQIAHQLGLACADAPDSQEICWLPDGDYASFIEQKLGSCPAGEFISPDGTVCGQHKGLLHYTVGQRKHLGVALG